MILTDIIAILWCHCEYLIVKNQVINNYRFLEYRVWHIDAITPRLYDFVRSEQYSNSSSSPVNHKLQSLVEYCLEDLKSNEVYSIMDQTEGLNVFCGGYYDFCYNRVIDASQIFSNNLFPGLNNERDYCLRRKTGHP